MKSIQLADYIIQTLVNKGVDTAFLVTGGMAMHLNNALAQEDRLRSICCHHEQACSLAAEGYAHVTGKPALVQVTAGPGAINAMNGVFGAYVDGLPMIVISGQSKRETLCATYGLSGNLRQAGEQEVDAIGMVRPITKYATQVLDPTHIRYELEKAWHIATTGRPGPVWLEIPVDVQGQTIEPEKLRGYHVPFVPPANLADIATTIAEAIAKAERPALVVGSGVRLGGSLNIGENDIAQSATNNTMSNAVDGFIALAEQLQCPVLCAGSLDIIQKSHPLYAGGIGNVGTRAGNITVQNADLLIFLGVSMHLTFTTYNWSAMGKNARKIVVECEAAECERPQYIADETILCGTKEFIDALRQACEENHTCCNPSWLRFCRERVERLPAVPERLRTLDEAGRINPYWFAEELFKRLGDNDVVVPGNASAGVTAQQAGSLRKGQRLIANFGNGPMGFALPAALGAAQALQSIHTTQSTQHPQGTTAPAHSRIICLDGDGSFMMNMQELATVALHKMPIIIFIYNNAGYMSIRQTQNTFFRKKLGCDAESGVSFPDFVALANAFGVPAMRLQGENWQQQLDAILQQTGPMVVDVMLNPEQGFEPKISSRRLSDGRMVSLPPEDMFPFLSREELQSHLQFPLDDLSNS